jgi:hypothetical protein
MLLIDGFAGSLEEQWAIYDSKVSHDEVSVDALETNEDAEDLDDRESLDQMEMARSSIYRFLRKLSRYYVACSVITSELVALVRSGAKPNITVETVHISMIASTPANENEYPSFESFFEQCMRVDLKSLDPKKVDLLRDKWPLERESQILYLHAEMQIALFYALNPQLCPVQGFIGVSKKCCWCCNFVLTLATSFNFVDPRVHEFGRYLQIPSDKDRRYNTEISGTPLFFSVQGTQSHNYSSWVFPNPSTHLEIGGGPV